MVKHSHDIYPQYFVVSLTLSGTDTATQGTINLPVPRIPTSGKATIIELLWLEVNYTGFNPSSTANSSAYLGISTDDRTIDSTTLNTFTANPHTVATYIYRQRAFGTATGAYEVQWPFVINLQSNDGKGFLIAGDRLYISADSATSSAADTFVVRFFYRFVDVSINEYVGIVQSQTQ